MLASMSTITAILEPQKDGTLHLPVPWSHGRFWVVARVVPQEEHLPYAEHAMVRLAHDLPLEGMSAGARGTVVHVYDGGVGYEVEFIRTGEKPRLITVEATDIEPA
jgi:hypothetical protein